MEGSSTGQQPDEARFEELLTRVEPSLRRAFVALYGPEAGRDAVAEAMAYAWENLESVEEMANPAGYLYRVGQSRSRRRRVGFLVQVTEEGIPDNEPALLGCLERLSERQRVAVVLCKAYEWTIAEAAEFMGVSRGSVQRHLERGLARLRGCLDP